MRPSLPVALMAILLFSGAGNTASTAWKRTNALENEPVVSGDDGASMSISTPSVTPAGAPKANTKTPFLRGVNLGGWLVLEKWMNGELFSGSFSAANDQYNFDAMPGASDALKKHWDTFFTESDIQAIGATGINALRIPIGYWAYNNTGTPYLKGADVYMDKAIGWARKAGMKVWVDCHGSPGSQNGFDNSGHAGEVNWQKGNNMAHSIEVLKIMATK
jgi:glucan 1,3-beta-glucosidase